MKVETLKQLESILKLCRKQGVTDIKIDGIELHLAPTTKANTRKYTQLMPITPTVPQYTPGGITEDTPVAQAVEIATDELSEEELLFYSSRSDVSAQGQQ